MSEEFFIYRSDVNDPIRWDSEGIMSISRDQRLFAFKSEQAASDKYERKLVWHGRAKSQHGRSASGIALQLAANASRKQS